MNFIVTAPRVRDFWFGNPRSVCIDGAEIEEGGCARITSGDWVVIKDQTNDQVRSRSSGDPESFLYKL
jgi:hypothetical protein